MIIRKNKRLFYIVIEKIRLLGILRRRCKSNAMQIFLTMLCLVQLLGYPLMLSLTNRHSAFPLVVLILQVTLENTMLILPHEVLKQHIKLIMLANDQILFC